VTVVYVDGEPNGLADMVGELIRQNLERDPARRRLLAPCVVTIEVPDAAVASTIRLDRERVAVANGASAGADLRVRAGSGALLRLTATPLRFGLPDPLRPAGRAVIGDLLTRRVRIAGLARHPVATVRLSRLLSVAAS
jgi:hypothetical protein